MSRMSNRAFRNFQIHLHEVCAGTPCFPLQGASSLEVIHSGFPPTLVQPNSVPLCTAAQKSSLAAARGDAAWATGHLTKPRRSSLRWGEFCAPVGGPRVSFFCAKEMLFLSFACACLDTSGKNKFPPPVELRSETGEALR